MISFECENAKTGAKLAYSIIPRTKLKPSFLSSPGKGISILENEAGF
jgi:hypothetical protein